MKIGIKRNRNAYKNLFEKRFKKEISLSIEKSEDEFYLELIQLIACEYKTIIEQQLKLENENYITEEKIRLEAKLSQKEGGIDESLTDMLKTILPIGTFGVGIVMGMFNDGLIMNIDNAIKSMPEKELATKFIDVYFDLIVDLGKNVILFVAMIILVTLFTHIASNFLNNKSRKDNNILRGFSMMCLNVLREIEAGKI